MDIKEKIAKLLALADSPNEHEAKAALQKQGSLWLYINCVRMMLLR